MKRSTLRALAAAGIFGGAIVSANATVIFNYTTTLTGQAPSGTPPFATLTIDNIGTDTVRLALSHNAGSASGQFITKLYLNLTSVPGNMTHVPPLDPKIDGVPTYGNDAFSDAGYLFDVNVDFHTSNANGGALRLKPGETVLLDLTGSGLDENDFLTTATGSPEQIYSMIHIQGTNNGLGSAKVVGEVVPEPATLLAIGTGLAALAARRRRKA